MRAFPVRPGWPGWTALSGFQVRSGRASASLVSRACPVWTARKAWLCSARWSSGPAGRRRTRPERPRPRPRRPREALRRGRGLAPRRTVPWSLGGYCASSWSSSPVTNGEHRPSHSWRHVPACLFTDENRIARATTGGRPVLPACAEAPTRCACRAPARSCSPCGAGFTQGWFRRVEIAGAGRPGYPVLGTRACPPGLGPPALAYVAARPLTRSFMRRGGLGTTDLWLPRSNPLIMPVQGTRRRFGSARTGMAARALATGPRSLPSRRLAPGPVCRPGR